MKTINFYDAFNIEWSILGSKGVIWGVRSLQWFRLVLEVCPKRHMKKRWQYMFAGVASQLKLSCSSKVKKECLLQ